MSRYSVPRGTARAIRRGNVAPSLGFIPFNDLIGQDDIDAFESYAWEQANLAEKRDREERAALYHDFREDGFSHQQAMLMSGLGDPDSLRCS
jgi:hypothetical protein